jgi:hypothetical protein
MDGNMANAFACWTTKATNTHSEYVIHIAFPQQQLLQLQELASVLHFMYVTCLVAASFGFTFPSSGKTSLI